MSILREALSHGMQLPAWLPSVCLLCGDTIAGRGFPLCPGCQQDLPGLPAARCPRCATPHQAASDTLCGACQQHPPHFDACFAPWEYTFPLDLLIQRFKYQQGLALAELFAAGLAAALPPDFHADDLLPLPLHPRRLGQRGFNQAQEIARSLHQQRPDCASTLQPMLAVRQFDTPPQAGLPWRTRRRNLRNAFLCTTDLSGRHIAIIDDVITSGATCNALARSLKQRGAARVTVLAVARALKNQER